MPKLRSGQPQKQQATNNNPAKSVSNRGQHQAGSTENLIQNPQQLQPAQILQLQRLIGNQAVRKLVQRQTPLPGKQFIQRYPPVRVIEQDQETWYLEETDQTYESKVAALQAYDLWAQENKKPNAQQMAAARGPVQFDAEEMQFIYHFFTRAYNMLRENQSIGMTSPLTTSFVLSDLVDEHRSSSENVYTQRTGLTPFNLAQTIIGHSESYQRLNSLITRIKGVGVTDEDLLRMLVSGSYAEFDHIFERVADRLYGEQSPPPVSSGHYKGTRPIRIELTKSKKRELSEVKEKIWMMVQLWNLEAVRRLSGGALNAVNATLALQQGDREFSQVFIDENLLSHEDASGKSNKNSRGKYQRLQKAKAVINRLLTTATKNPLLINLQIAIGRFFFLLFGQWSDDAVQEARQAWTGLISTRTTEPTLPREMSQNLEHSQALQTIFQYKEYKSLIQAFSRFLQAYYDPKVPDRAAVSDFPPKPASTMTIDDDFAIWLIDKAASQAHGNFLDMILQAITSSDISGKHPLEVLTHYNRDYTRAITQVHNTLMRYLVDIQRKTSNLSLLDNIRIHTGMHSSHVELALGKYEKSIPDIAKLAQLYQSPDKAVQAIVGVLQARNQQDFEKRVQLLYQLAESVQLSGSATKEVQAALSSLYPLWRVYNIIEVTRDPGAGGINMMVLFEGMKKDGNSLNLEELFIKYNVMSPEGVNSDDLLKIQQIEAILQDVRFQGLFSQQIKELFFELQLNMDNQPRQIQIFEKMYLLAADFLTHTLDDQATLSSDTSEEELTRNFNIGTARGTGNNCLIHTLLQLAQQGTRSYVGNTDEQTVSEYRQRLNQVFPFLDPNGMLDFYGNDGTAILEQFMVRYGFRVQVYQVLPGNQIVIHPVRGINGPLLYILHHGNHFQPMIPKH